MVAQWLMMYNKRGIIMRKMATIRTITDIQPIDGADNIDVAIVDGWKVVVKKGEFNIGDDIVYLEIDSWVPESIAPFLVKPGHIVDTYKNVAGVKLRTVKLRGQISQGLILPVSVCNGYRPSDGSNDVSEYLNIQKWETTIPAQLSGDPKGNFPSRIPKTDQDRAQNKLKEIRDAYEKGIRFEVTEKLDGSSMTVYLMHNDVSDWEFGVCSRNLNLKNIDGNTYWDVAKKYNLEGLMYKLGMLNMAIQGELVGPGIQGNPYKLNEHKFYMFDIYDIKAGRYLSYTSRSIYHKVFGDSVPVIDVVGKTTKPAYCNIDELLQYAEGKSALNPNVEREGLVFKSDKLSFKVVSNKYLLKNKR